MRRAIKTVMPADFRRTHLQAYQRNILDRVGRGSDHWAMFLGAGATYDDWIPFVLARNLQHRLIGVSISKPTGPKVEPFVEANRWIAKCECGGAETVDPSERRFYCLSCYNVLNDHKPRPIAWRNSWKDIERVMAARPDPLNRGQYVLQNPETFAWVVMDDLKELEAENVKHGLPARAED